MPNEFHRWRPVQIVSPTAARKLPKSQKRPEKRRFGGRRRIRRAARRPQRQIPVPKLRNSRSFHRIMCNLLIITGGVPTSQNNGQVFELPAKAARGAGSHQDQPHFRHRSSLPRNTQQNLHHLETRRLQKSVNISMTSK